MVKHPPKALSETNLTTSLDKICLCTLLGNYIIWTFWQGNGCDEKMKTVCPSYIIFLKVWVPLRFDRDCGCKEYGCSSIIEIFFCQSHIIIEILQSWMDYTHTHTPQPKKGNAPGVKACMKPWCKRRQVTVWLYADVCRFVRVCINGRAWLTVWVPVLTQCDWVGDVSALCWQCSPFVTILSHEMGRRAPVGPESPCLPLRNPTLSMYRHVYGPKEHPSHGN